MQHYGCVSHAEALRERCIGFLVIWSFLFSPQNWHLWSEDYWDEIFREQPGRSTKTLGLHETRLSSIFKEIDFTIKYRPAAHLQEGTEIKSVTPNWISRRFILRHGDDTIGNTNASGAIKKTYTRQAFDPCIHLLRSVFGREILVIKHQLSACVMILLYSGHNARNKSKLWRLHNWFELYCSFRLYIKLAVTELWHRLLWPLIYTFGMLSPSHGVLLTRGKNEREIVRRLHWMVPFGGTQGRRVRECMC